MSLLNVFKFRKQPTAIIAKERLKIIVAHQRVERHRGNLDLEELRKRLMAVVRDFLNIDDSQFRVELKQNDMGSVLELNVTLPEGPAAHTTH